MNGTDELGYRYLEQAVEMANSLDLFKPSAVASRKKRNARELTAWVLYGWQGVMAYMHQRLPLCQDAPVSTLPDPFEHPQWYGEIWFKFPSAPTMFSTHLSQFTKAKIELWCIASTGYGISDRGAKSPARRAFSQPSFDILFPTGTLV
ncbi:hypothetical protein ACHAPV_008818 [Trichoderma viride]